MLFNKVIYIKIYSEYGTVGAFHLPFYVVVIHYFPKVGPRHVPAGHLVVVVEDLVVQALHTSLVLREHPSCNVVSN